MGLPISRNADMLGSRSRNEQDISLDHLVVDESKLLELAHYAVHVSPIARDEGSRYQTLIKQCHDAPR